MSTDHYNDADTARRQQSPEQDPVMPHVDPATVPEAVQQSDVDRRRKLLEIDTAEEAADVEAASSDVAEKSKLTRARGVEWVRPTDLMARHSSALAGRGLELHTRFDAELRGKISAARTALGQQARRLSPLSSFGRSARHEAPTRAAVGKA